MTRFDPDILRQVAREHGTPCYLYDAAVLRARVAALGAFDVVRFAQKACPNLHILRLLRAEGCLVDSVSAGELERALRAGFSPGGEPSGIIYTSDIFDDLSLDLVCRHGIPVNAGSEDMLDQLGQRSPGHPVWLRLNPGFGHGHSQKVNTGGESSKHGIWHGNLDDALTRVKTHGLKLVGLHMHIGSGADVAHLKRVCGAMVAQVRRVVEAGFDLQAISGGGGLSVPYRQGDQSVDTGAYHRSWDQARREVEALLGHPVSLELEPGRYIAAESGVLLARVRATKSMGDNFFTMVDAGFDNLVRPAMYGAWHEISVLSAEPGGRLGPSGPTLVAGPLCESGDVFTQKEGGLVEARPLPRASVGDLVVFHDTGAYASSMASNYVSRSLAPEVLVDGDVHQLIRRRQTIGDLLDLESC